MAHWYNETKPSWSVSCVDHSQHEHTHPDTYTQAHSHAHTDIHIHSEKHPYTRKGRNIWWTSWILNFDKLRKRTVLFFILNREASLRYKVRAGLFQRPHNNMSGHAVTRRCVPTCCYVNLGLFFCLQTTSPRRTAGQGNREITCGHVTLVLFFETQHSLTLSLSLALCYFVLPDVTRGRLAPDVIRPFDDIEEGVVDGRCPFSGRTPWRAQWPAPL